MKEMKVSSLLYSDNFFLLQKWKRYFLENLIFLTLCLKKQPKKTLKNLSSSKIGDSSSFPITALRISTPFAPQNVTGWLAWGLRDISP